MGFYGHLAEFPCLNTSCKYSVYHDNEEKEQEEKEEDLNSSW